MFLLSLLSFFNFYSFVLLGLYIIKLNPKQEINIIGACVDFCFAIWDFAFVFFYMSDTANEAMIWHKISAIGWIMFCPFATHFFLILSEKAKNHNRLRIYVSLYLLPFILLIKTFFSNESPIAKGIKKSNIGLGWTYISNIESEWYWIYLVQMAVYIGVALYFTYQWAKRENRIKFLKQIKNIILVDSFLIIFGYITDLILPIFGSDFPPLFNIISIFWGVGSLLIVRNYKLLNVNEAATPELILETVLDPIIMIDRNGIIVRCNQATASLMKYKAEEMIGKSLFDYYDSKKYPKEYLINLFQKRAPRNVEAELIDGEGNIIDAVASYSIAENKLDGFLGVVVSLHNVTEYKKLTQTLENLANYDKLTNLANRRLFDNKLNQAIENYKMTGEKFAVIFMDLDGFKNINDRYGHDIGDKLLLEISKRMLSAIRKKDTLARLGGDEFVLLFTDLVIEANLVAVIDRLREYFCEAVNIENNICKVGISFGVSRCPEDGLTIDELMKKADERMYGEKSDKYKR
ncbi:diguanylate cyclase domain-containing protein [Anaerosacchariphilus polymeriproducens]|uniref:Diguanylate cyclase n=1 Tax=Anaerosacchariphilus polymeriproducens TaxID=1812858 RepID=A0A371AT49_9FIRM|nr:diguanylate cyclase [Anaerosacchariphilus polymeriproducens]RDU22640.1 diguanylate cyclase [Anaerosacchariphilus polymeriproducens]